MKPIHEPGEGDGTNWRLPHPVPGSARPPGKRVSIFEVARRADCSITSVSNVLNNKGRVSQEKRRAVLDAVAELGYRVNSVGRNLRTRRTETLGLLFYPSCAEIFRNPFYAEVMEGLEERLTKASFHLLLAGYHASTVATGVPDFLSRGKVDGMILLGGFPAKVVRNFLEMQIPLLLLDSNVEWPVDSVVSDGFSAGAMVVRHLADQGHRRIVMMAYPEESYNGRLRIQGFLAGLQEAGLGQGEVIEAAFSHDALYETLKTRLEAPEPPTAMVAVNDTLALAMIQRLVRDGISVPERLSVVGYNDDRIAADAVPRLATVRVEKRELGMEGANLILNRVGNPDAAIVKLRMPVSLVAGGTVCPPSVR
ncbi:MAG TPA: LacI family DNA-binding transcriptional regulator [Candidatus Methylacidiphilales bacterium]